MKFGKWAVILEKRNSFFFFSFVYDVYHTDH